MKSKTLIICLIFSGLIAFLLRSRNLINTFPFTMDEEYQALLAQNMFQTGHLPLIGVNISNTGLYLGPLFAYFNYLLYWLGRGNPVINAWAAVIIGTITTIVTGVLSYKLAREFKLKNPSFLAFMAGTFYAVSPLIVAYDKKFWNPSLLPLLGILGFYSLIKIYLGQINWLLLLAVLTGVSLHTHISFLIFPLLAGLIMIKKKLRPKQKTVIFSLLIFFIFLLPLILFELRHNFIQVVGLTNYLFNLKGAGFSLSLLLPLIKFISRAVFLPTNDLANELSLCPDVIKSFSWFVASGLLIFFGFLLVRFRRNLLKIKPLLLIFSLLLISFGLVSFLIKGAVSEYYFNSLLPVLAVVLALIINSSRQRLVYLGFFLYLLILSANSLKLINSYGLSKKINLIAKAALIIGQEPYQLDAEPGCRSYEGYHYLFSYYFKPPVKSYMDSYFDWLYPVSGQTAVSNIVTVFPGPVFTITKL